TNWRPGSIAGEAVVGWLPLVVLCQTSAPVAASIAIRRPFFASAKRRFLLPFDVDTLARYTGALSIDAAMLTLYFVTSVPTFDGEISVSAGLTPVCAAS